VHRPQQAEQRGRAFSSGEAQVLKDRVKVYEGELATLEKAYARQE